MFRTLENHFIYQNEKRKLIFLFILMIKVWGHIFSSIARKNINWQNCMKNNSDMAFEI